MQNHIMFGTYQPPDPDEDGYQPSLVTTKSSNSTTTMRGVTKNAILYVKERYSLKWSNIKASVLYEILKQISGKVSFDFFYYCPYKSEWRTAKFYVTGDISYPAFRLNDGEEMIDSLSFEVESVEPI